MSAGSPQAHLVSRVMVIVVGDQRERLGGGSGAEPDGIWATSCMIAPWRVTAPSSTVESRARRVLPAKMFVASITLRTAPKIRCGRSLDAQLVAPQRQHRRMKPSSVKDRPAATFHEIEFRNCATASRIRQPSSARDHHRRDHVSRHRRTPRPEPNRSPNMSSGNTRRRCSARIQ